MDIHQTAKTLLFEAKKCGATGARVASSESHGYSVVLEQGNARPEINHDRDALLVVYVGQRTAVVRTSTTTEVGLRRLAQKAVEMARGSMEDPFASLAEEALWPRDVARLQKMLDKVDPNPLTTLDELTKSVLEIEDASMSKKGIKRT